MNTGFVFDRLKKATQTAFNRVGKTASVVSDPDLNLYGKLKPEDFGKLINQYGADQTLQYIKEMEHKKVTAGG